MMNYPTKQVLKYGALILRKVSFDRHLFEKEFHKARRALDARSRRVLDRWVRRHYRELVPQRVESGIGPR